MNTEPKKYNINSFEKLCNVVTKENATRLAIDLGQWLVYYAHTISEIREKHPKETNKKTNSKIAECTFIWIDDGKHDLLEAIVEDKDTGEVLSVKQPNSEQNVQVSDTTGLNQGTKS